MGDRLSGAELYKRLNVEAGKAGEEKREGGRRQKIIRKSCKIR